MILRAALGLMLCLFIALPAEADSGALIAVRGIDVDVTASNAVDAREQAILQGQRKGLRQAMLMLAPAADVDRLPTLSDSQITDLVADYEVESEQTSTVRYIGKLAFRYHLDAIGNLLQQSGVPAATTASPPVLVLPVLAAGGKNLLWGEGNAWRDAWSAHPPSGGLVDLILPRGDPTDVAAISADQAVAGDAAKIQALAAHYSVSDVAVIVARPDANTAGVAFSVTRYGIAGPTGTFQDQVAGDPTNPEAAYGQAIDRIADRFQQDWIAQNPVTSGIEQHLTVDALISGLAQWAELRRRLASVANLRHVEVIYLMQSHAELDLVFIGDRNQLARSLQQRALLLRDSGEGHTTLELAAVQP